MPDDPPSDPATSLPSNIKSLKRKLLMTSGHIQAINDKGRIAFRDPTITNVNQFKGMYLSLSGYWQKFEDLWYALADAYDEINRPIDFPNKEEAIVESNARRYFYEANATYVSLTEGRGSNDNPDRGVSNVTLNESVSRSSKLPKIPLPPFDGKILNWPKFKDAFVSLIHEDNSISPIQKFHYLLGAVSGAAHTIVSKLPLVGENYLIVWDNLIKAYDNKRLHAAAYLNELLHFKPQTGKPTVASYQLFLTKVAESVSAFERLNVKKPAEFILFHIAIKTLDPITREQFEIENKQVEFPTFKNLADFVQSRSIAMQLADQNFASTQHETKTSSNNEIHKSKNNNNNKSSVKRNSKLNTTTTLLSSKTTNDGSTKQPSNAQSTSICCAICKQPHKLLDCLKFTDSTNQQRSQWLKFWNGCKNCLSESHNTSSCKSSWHCRFCPEKHHSMLHLESSGNNSSNKPNTNARNSASTSTNSLQCNHTISAQGSQVLLGTLVAEIEDAFGNYQQIRIVIDSGSQSSFITKKCLNRLKLDFIKMPKKISCLGNTMFDGIKGKTKCSIRPRGMHSPTFVTDAMVVQKITNNLPNVTLFPQDWKMYLTYQLADEKFWESNSIDFLMGCDLSPEIWTGEIITIDENRPKLFSSVFGYVVCGKINSNDSTNNSTTLFTFDAPDVRDELHKFWELEEPPEVKISNPEDEYSEEHFSKTHYRDSSGRYVVSLLFKEDNPRLGPSSAHALKRLSNLERKLQRNADFSNQYKDFMREYIDMGHMYLSSSPANYIIPHHGIVKEDRNVNKLRVVFDASAQTSLGSLNDILITGPKLQTDIRDILLKWRIHNIVLVADIVKMYRHILINPEDRTFQHIYWRFDASDKVEEYELATVTYGLSAAPYLALRTMLQLKIDEGHNFPLAYKVIPNDMYVDDLVTGADSMEEAIQLKNEVINMFKRGGFYLSKWASNKTELLTSGSDEDDNESVSFSFDEEITPSIKILGLKWNSTTDSFSYSVSSPPIVSTKRSLLSSVAKIYDPLGFLAPTVFQAKSFIQELWKLKLDWDDALPRSVQSQWSDFVLQLPNLSEINIPRLLTSERPLRYHIVGFCDASEKGYGASIYIRMLESHDTIQTKLLIAKTKLAPIKTITIPRLELCGALLLAKVFSMLYTFFRSLPPPEFPPTFFTDSMVVLGWLKTPTYSLKTFVANRVHEILTVTKDSEWLHVRTDDNPSDCCSRGLMPNDLINHSLWWFGPSWLKQPMEAWPKFNITPPEDLPECKFKDSTIHALVTTHSSINIDWMSRYSSYIQLMRFVGTILRFIHNKKNKNEQKFGPMTAKEFLNAEQVCFRLVQLKHFFGGNIKKNKTLIFDRFRKLSPYLDSLDILRVGGRLNNSNLNNHHKHPILLPNKSHFTVLKVDYYHRLYLHPGPGLLQALIQLKFWIPSLRQLVRQRTFMCLICFKQRNANKFDPPPMGDLPDFRVSEGGRVFQHVGIDFGGPFSIRESLRRKSALGKAYLCLFICMQTKALHLEVVSSLSTEAFLACLSRFIAKHGVPEHIYSDNGTNFQGAANQLKELQQWFDEEATQNSILQHCSPNKIHWHFNPVKAPHFGGLWEAGIKSVKGHLRRVIGDAKLTFEELDTIFKSTEAILNSRPLCPISGSPEEIDYLSPAHFLIGGNLMGYPEPILLDLRENRLSRWQLVKQKIQHLWKRWRKEYLSTLQQKSKWTKCKMPKIQEGSLVLLKDNCPVTQWPLGRVTALHPGKDGIPRVATVQTANSSFRRLLVQLVPLLPLSQPPYDVCA